MTLSVFILLIVTANIIAGMTFGLDKVAAVRGERRIPEKNLLVLTLLGGVGAMSACSLFRHKTRKQPFRFYAKILTGLHIVLVAFIVTLLI